MFLKLAISLVAFCSISAAQARDVRVIDGDTIVTNSGEHVRLSGIDAPEIHKGAHDPYKCDAELQLGLKAKARVQELLSGQDYRVVNVTYKGKKRVDLYGRTLAKVRVGKTDIGTTLINEGLAKPWSGKGPKPDWCGTGKK